MSNILLIDTSPTDREAVRQILSHHQVHEADTAEVAHQIFEKTKIELIVLELQLSGTTGLSFMSQLQERHGFGNIPIVCLCRSASVSDKISAFSLGAEDYIVKGVDPLELRARIDARVRQHSKWLSVRSIGALKIDTGGHRVMIKNSAGETELALTQTEFKLLCCLTHRPDQTYSRDQLLDSAWSGRARVSDRVIDVHLCSLRKKLGRFSHYIRAVPGVGYRFSVKDQ